MGWPTAQRIPRLDPAYRERMSRSTISFKRKNLGAKVFLALDMSRRRRIIFTRLYDAIAFPPMSSPHSPRKVHLVGSRIRELRKGRHLTQVELSEKIGVAQSDLSRMEQGEYKVGLDTLFKILQVFDLKMSEFFGETEQPVDPDSRELVSDFRGLSEDARREVRDFVRFKRLQQDEQLAETAVETPPPAEEKP